MRFGGLRISAPFNQIEDINIYYHRYHTTTYYLKDNGFIYTNSVTLTSARHPPLCLLLTRGFLDFDNISTVTVQKRTSRSYRKKNLDFKIGPSHICKTSNTYIYHRISTIRSRSPIYQWLSRFQSYSHIDQFYSSSKGGCRTYQSSENFLLMENSSSYQSRSARVQTPEYAP